MSLKRLIRRSRKMNLSYAYGMIPYCSRLNKRLKGLIELLFPSIIPPSITIFCLTFMTLSFSLRVYACLTSFIFLHLFQAFFYNFIVFL